jgi:hypothetical protein
MSGPTVDWNKLKERYGDELITTTRRLFAEGGPFTTTAEELVSENNSRKPDAERLLKELCPPLQAESTLGCPNCKDPIDTDDARLGVCPHCHERFDEHGGVVVSQIYAYSVLPTRDVTWVLALHGMNTRGAWQEEFNWRVSTAYLRSVPVAIYKYGLVRPGALWLPSLRRLSEELAAKIVKLKGVTEENGFAGPPDVIAHSLGTWLLGHALLWNPSLKVGRIILTGSILRPDFDWATLIARGQVEAVLDHYGMKDRWVAHYAIPDSGPSGRVGFNAHVPVVQACEPEFKHSDFFSEKNLPEVFEKVWRPFLTMPAGDLLNSYASSGAKWRQARWIYRATLLRSVLLTAFWGSLAVLMCFCIVGGFTAVAWLRR